MRGKPEDMVAEIVGTRITPAYAGKTAAANLIAKAQEDHPRVCGENEIKSFIIELDRGSPPRMRGKLI